MSSRRLVIRSQRRDAVRAQRRKHTPHESDVITGRLRPVAMFLAIDLLHPSALSPKIGHRQIGRTVHSNKKQKGKA